jgi:hypothetical protein
MILKKFISYIAFWKKAESDDKTNLNLKVMHGINKISILLFLMALTVIIVRLLRS